MRGLKDKPRSGRPADVSVEKLLEVRKELSENPSGWKVKQIMNIIYERTGVRYIMKSTFIDCYISGGSNPKYHKGDSLIQHQKKRKKRSKKG